MAEEGDEKKKAAAKSEHPPGLQVSRKQYPPGFRFAPTSEELVKYYLLPRLQGMPTVPNDAIIEDYVYWCHPDKLIAKYRDRGEDSWYFLSPRARKYDNGERPSRHTVDCAGRWKASTGKEEAEAEEKIGAGGTRFWKTVLAYFNAPISKEKKTRWLMHELTLPEYEKKIGHGGSDKKSSLDDFVMCKIYVTTKKNKKSYNEAGPSGECKEECPPAASEPGPAESGGQGTSAGPGPKLSEKLAGKRRMEESPCGAGSMPECARQRVLHMGPPAPLHRGGMQGSPFRTTAGYYGGPMAYNARAPMPRQPAVCTGGPPAAAHNGMQVPVQQQMVAYNGQQVPLQQQVVAYNGMQVPVQQQMVAYNGQQVPVQQQVVAYNGQQVPVQRQPLAFNRQARPPPYRIANAPNPCGQRQAMMRRPPNPSGQAAVKPPSSSISRPPMKREQPETEEMRAQRVYRQVAEEYVRLMKEQPTLFPPHQPYFGAGVVNDHHARAVTPQFPTTYNFYSTREAGQQSQSSLAAPAPGGSNGVAAPASPEAMVSVSVAGNEGNGKCDLSNDDEKLVELATRKTSPGGDDPSQT